MAALLLSMILAIPAPVQINYPTREVIAIEGNTITLADGTETENWFLIDDNNLIY